MPAVKGTELRVDSSLSGHGLPVCSRGNVGPTNGALFLFFQQGTKNFASTGVGKAPFSTTLHGESVV